MRQIKIEDMEFNKHYIGVETVYGEDYYITAAMIERLVFVSL